MTHYLSVTLSFFPLQPFRRLSIHITTMASVEEENKSLYTKRDIWAEIFPMSPWAELSASDREVLCRVFRRYIDDEAVPVSTTAVSGEGGHRMVATPRSR